MPDYQVPDAIEAERPVEEAHGADRSGSNGLTILFPRGNDERFPAAYRRATSHLDFAAESS